MNKDKIKNMFRALRLPFVTASVLPFIFGSIAAKNHFDTVKFLLGMVAVVFTHLSANLINDYADSRSRVDWQDKTYYNFFGGSKLIQEGVLSEGFYFKLAVFFAVLSALSVITISLMLKSAFALCVFLIAMSLGWAYSTDPFKLAYRRFGEVIIFVIFGPLVVMAGYFLQSGVFPDAKSFILSLPFGFFTTAILYANEIPDFIDDRKMGKFNLVSVFGSKRAHIFYYLLMYSGFIFIVLSVALRFLHPAALASLLVVFAVHKAAGILKRHPHDKKILMESSMLTIAIQALAGLILIVAVIL